MEEVTAFTDGASRGNPGPAGWGSVIAASDHVEELGGGKKQGTNNWAEVAAVVAVVKWLAENHAEIDSVEIHSDSTYTISGASSWIHGWRKRGWKTKAGEPISNKKLWQQYDRLQSEVPFTITFNKVKGHASVPGNERADDIATGFADGGDIDLYSGPRSEYEVSLDPEPQYLEKSPVYLSLIDGVAVQHDSWKDCQARVSGESAQYKKVHTVAERDDLLTEWEVPLEDLKRE